MPSEVPYETVFSRWRAHLEKDEHDEELHDAEEEMGIAEEPPASGPLRAFAKVPLAVWTLLGLFAGLVFGYFVPELAFLGQGVRDVLGYLGVAVPLIIFFTITPALIAMYKTSSAGRFALYVMIGFTVTTMVGGLFALLISLLFFPDMTLGIGAGGLGSVLSDLIDRTGALLFTSQAFKAIWAALGVSALLYFGGNLRGEPPTGALRRMLRTIADIYHLIGVHGVSAIGRVIKVIMPFALFAIGVFLVATLGELIRGATDDSTLGLAEPPWTGIEAYFVSVGVLVVITLLWLAIAAFALSQYTRFPLGRMLREYVFVVYPFAWATSSSSISLPLNIEAARKGLGVRTQVRSFVLPIGATVNLDGTMMAAVVATIVASKMVGYTPSVLDMLIALIPLLFITIGTPGVPGGLAFVSAPVMSALLPLPPGTAAIFIPVYIALLIGLNDMFRTAVNTLDNGFLALLLDKWWPERFQPGAEPNPFMRVPDEHIETEGARAAPVSVRDEKPLG